MRLILLPDAIADLKSIHAYIACNNRTAARRVAEKLKALILSLQASPHLGRPGRLFGTRELVTPPVGRTAYLIVYQVKDEHLEILRILPGMRDVETILRNTAE
jgi:toxin ParE1/3/4